MIMHQFFALDVRHDSFAVATPSMKHLLPGYPHARAGGVEEAIVFSFRERGRVEAAGWDLCVRADVDTHGLMGLMGFMGISECIRCVFTFLC